MDTKHLSKQQMLILKMAKLTEDELTTTVIIPLLKSMRWESVDYHGGPYEGGKDIICWRKGEFDLVELLVVQVKKYKPSAKASSNKNIGEVVNQLHQASEKKVPNVNGHSYIPDMIFFITPFEIDVRSLESRFEGYRELANRRVKIIDGSILAKQVINNLPSIVNMLIGNEFAISQAIVPTLNNKELLNSLNINDSVKISSYYCDLSFGIGHITTKILLEMVPTPISTHKCLNNEDWKDYRHEVRSIQSAMSCEIFDQSDTIIEQKYHNNMSEFQRGSDTISVIEKNINNFESQLNTLGKENEKVLTSVKEAILKNAKDIENEYKSLADDFFSSYRHINDEKFSEENKNDKEYINLDISIISLEKYIWNTSNYESNLKKIDEIEKSIYVQQEELSTRLNQQTTPKYEFTVKGNDVCKKIIELKDKLKIGMSAIEKNHSPSQLVEFISECEKILTLSDRILSSQIIEDLICVETTEKYRIAENIPRLNFSVHDIFDTGYNTFILGEAGAGKTTTLQMYAQKKYNNLIEDSPTTLFIPLTRSIHALEIDGIQEYSDRPYDVRLVYGIKKYLESVGVNITYHDLIAMLQEKRAILLLDGLDEAVSSAPWIHQGVTDLSEKYPKVQIITSSRMVGDYMGDIPFFSITLLPLSKEQRSEFVSSWFKENTDKVRYIEKHLDKNEQLDQIVRTPLLTTLLCVLADNEVQLPENEVRLYAERFQLLLGQYDIHKKVSRNTTPRITLEVVARKLAFLLHKSNKRYSKVDYLKKLAKGALSEKYDNETINTAINELINPCNVIVPMTTDGQFGFDHLRYQEYLVAEEIVNNRGVDITFYLSDPWWKGPLVLFSQLTDDLEFVISQTLINGRYNAYSENLNAMLKHRPEMERKRLNLIIQNHNKLDVMDDIIFQEPFYE